MLFAGMLLRNVPGIHIAEDLHESQTSILRQIALVVILIRAGLGLDPEALIKLSTVVIRLAFSPCCVEAIVIAITSHLILDFPWAWGFLMGYISIFNFHLLDPLISRNQLTIIVMLDLRWRQSHQQ